MMFTIYNHPESIELDVIHLVIERSVEGTVILEPLSFSFHSVIFRAGSPAILRFENAGLLEDLFD